MSNPKLYLTLAEKVRGLIQEGISLDRIQTKRLWLLIGEGLTLMFDAARRE
jgi:hypothetical protein